MLFGNPSYVVVGHNTVVFHRTPEAKAQIINIKSAILLAAARGAARSVETKFGSY